MSAFDPVSPRKEFFKYIRAEAAQVRQTNKTEKRKAFALAALSVGGYALAVVGFHDAFAYLFHSKQALFNINNNVSTQLLNGILIGTCLSVGFISYILSSNKSANAKSQLRGSLSDLRSKVETTCENVRQNRRWRGTPFFRTDLNPWEIPVKKTEAPKSSKKVKPSILSMS